MLTQLNCHWALAVLYDTIIVEVPTIIVLDIGHINIQGRKIGKHQLASNTEEGSGWQKADRRSLRLGSVLPSLTAPLHLLGAAQNLRVLPPICVDRRETERPQTLLLGQLLPSLWVLQ